MKMKNATLRSIEFEERLRMFFSPRNSSIFKNLLLPLKFSPHRLMAYLKSINKITFPLNIFFSET